MDHLYKPYFPLLSDVASKKTSDRDPKYNCIAWAFGDSRRHWWPNERRSYWPIHATGKTDMEAFEEWFARDGWTETPNPQVEAGFAKVALFAKDGRPTHAARLLPSGMWSSKLGQDIDLIHEIGELTGPEYGAICKIYRKPI